MDSQMSKQVETAVADARGSFSGRGLTDSQFHEAWAITTILDRHIHQSGSFREKLTDYAHAFARNDRFDAMRGESILRDIYTARFGRSLNQTREALMAAETALPEHAQTRALECAEAIGDMIQQPPTQPFYQAYDRAAVTLSNEFGITQAGAKALMKDAYARRHQTDLYEAGKALEEAYHKPVRAAEIAARKAEQLPSRAMGRHGP